MQLDDIIQFCLAKNGTSEHFPFDNDTLVFKVANKMFALTSMQEWENNTPAINLKCNPDKALELREEYEGISAGYHMNKTHWNTVKINADISDKLLKELIHHSYELVVKSLPKKERERLLS